MSQKAVKMQQDLEKKLERLCFIHDQTALHVANEFYELRNTIDVDTEELLARYREAHHDDAADKTVKANKTRIEFIRILRELEQRCLGQLPDTNTVSSAEGYVHFRKRIESLKDCSKDRLNKVYIELAMKLNEETYELEKRLLGEQTIVYVFSGDKTSLGQLIHIGEFRMRRHEMQCLRTFKLSPTETVYQKLSTCLQNTLLVKYELPCVVDKSYMILFRLVNYFTPASSGHSKYIYMAWDEQKPNGHQAEISSSNREFLSFRFPESSKLLQFQRVAGVAPSLDVLDYYSASKPAIIFLSSKLKNLDFLAHSSRNSLAGLSLFDVKLDVFDENLIANCTNLRKLVLEIEGASISSLNFLRSLKCLNSLSISLKDLNIDLTVLKDLESVESLSLTSSKNENKTPMKTRTMFKELSAIPNLKRLYLHSLDIDSIDKDAFAGFKKLTVVFLTSNTIGFLNHDAFNNGPNGKIATFFIENTIKAELGVSNVSFLNLL